MLRVAADAFIHCRVSSATKEALGALARHQGLTDSALLKRMIDLALQSVNASSPIASNAQELVSRVSRITVRLPADDQLLLRERASARAMAPATYVSALVRSHLRSLAPLPREELLVLKRIVSELGSIGRNVNQMARLANQGGQPSGPGREDLKAMLRLCEGVKDHVKGLLATNLRSWTQGYGQQNS